MESIHYLPGALPHIATPVRQLRGKIQVVSIFLDTVARTNLFISSDLMATSSGNRFSTLSDRDINLLSESRHEISPEARVYERQGDQGPSWA